MFQNGTYLGFTVMRTIYVHDALQQTRRQASALQSTNKCPLSYTFFCVRFGRRGMGRKEKKSNQNVNKPLYTSNIVPSS